MSVKVQLPPGCSGFDCKDGTKYTAKPGGTVTVEDRHASAINKGQYGQQDFISAKGALSFGTKASRHCGSCRRVWNAWNDTCPRCGQATTSEPGGC
jgi:hypothetical protein